MHLQKRSLENPKADVRAYMYEFLAFVVGGVAGVVKASQEYARKKEFVDWVEVGSNKSLEYFDESEKIK